jgi:serine/threonine protein kinase
VYTTKSDVYAYGVFLFELFTLLEARFVKAYLSNEQEPSAPKVSAEIEELIYGCCAKSTQDRFNISDVVKKLSDQIQHSSSSNAEGKEEEEAESSLPSVGFSWGMNSKLPLFQQTKSSANEAQNKIHERRHSFS